MIDHAKFCKRPTPLLRRSWDGQPEHWCRECGRSAPAPVDPSGAA